MGTGKTKSTKKNTKKSTKKSKKKESNPERDLLSEQLKKTGPFVLRDFCSAHGMEDYQKAPKKELIEFLEGKFDDGEITINDLYPEEDPEDVDIDNEEDEEDEEEETSKSKKGKKSKKPAKKRTTKKKKKPEPEPEDDEDDDDDDDLDDDDDDLDDDDLDIDDDDDDDDDEPPKKGKKEVSSLEDKIDKLMDLSTQVGSAVDDLTQLQLEHKEFVRLATTYLIKLGGVDKVKAAKLIKKMEKKAKDTVCADEQEEEQKPPSNLRKVSDSDQFVTVNKKELESMSEKELRDFARSVGISIDMCDTKDHVLTRVLLSCQEFANY